MEVVKFENGEVECKAPLVLSDLELAAVGGGIGDVTFG